MRPNAGATDDVHLARIEGRIAAMLLAAMFLAACGGDGSGSGGVATATPAPTETPAPSPTPGCGNGLVDPGELCDGEEWCTPSCNLDAVACCDFAESPAAPEFCLETNLTAGRACAGTGGAFAIGAVCTGEPCPDGPEGCRVGSCVTPVIPATTVCCQHAGEGCEQATFTDLASLTDFVALVCRQVVDQEAVVGTCGADGRCVPRR